MLFPYVGGIPPISGKISLFVNNIPVRGYRAEDIQLQNHENHSGAARWQENAGMKAGGGDDETPFRGRPLRFRSAI